MDPENAKLLLGPFPGLSLDGKQLVLDLLASAGTPAAQEVMRTLLANATLRQDKEYPMLLQRLAVIDTPEPQNARYLVDSLTAARGTQPDVASASIVALGSTIGHLNQSTNPDYVAASEKYNQTLREALAQSGDDEHGHVAAVMALGNTKLPENAPLLAQETRDGSANVRANAAVALRSYGDDASFDALVALLADSERDVRQSALTSIGERTLSDAQVGRLAAAIVAGRTDVELDTSMVGVLAPHLDAGAATIAALRHIFERNGADPRLQASILALLPHP
jgi:HEAT repeat protein